MVGGEKKKKKGGWDDEFNSSSSHRGIVGLATSSLHVVDKLEEVLVLWSERMIHATVDNRVCVGSAIVG